MSNQNFATRIGSSSKKSKIFQSARLAAELQEFFKTQAHYDIGLVVGMEKRKLKSHRSVLSNSSDYFQAMFRSNLQDAMADEIELKEVDATTMKMILDFLYSSRIELRCESVETLLRAADFLQIKALITACCDFMGEQLDTSNCLGIASFAEQHSYNDLYGKAFTFCYTNFAEVCNEEEFFQLNEQQLIKLLSCDKLCVTSETVVFHSLVAWVEYDMENREIFIFDLLSHVRFTFLKPKFIIENRNSVCKTIECYELICSWMQWHLSPEKRTQLPPELTKARMDNKKLVVLHKSSTFNFEAQIFDPEQNSWSYQRMPTPSRERSDYAATAINRKLIIAGGEINDVLTTSVECLDLKTMEWDDLPPMRIARKCHAMAELKGDLYVVGGYNKEWLCSVEKYDFSKREWQDVEPLQSPFACVKIAVHDDLLYAIGHGGTTMECYDADEKVWKQKAFKNKQSKYFGFSAVGEHLYAVGGNINGRGSKTVERYRPSHDTWTEVSNLSSERYSIECVTLNQKLIACGGFEDHIFSVVVEEYNPETDEWNTLAPLLSKDDQILVLTM